MSRTAKNPDEITGFLKLTGFWYDHYNVKVFPEGLLQNVQSDSHIENEYKTQVEQAYEKYVKEKLDQTIRKCQALNCDVFDFGHKAAAKFRTIQDWEEYDRLSRFKDAEVETEVDFIMRRTGALITTEEEKEAQES